MTTEIIKVKLADLKGYHSNPRQIKKDDFEQLKRSLNEFPEMLEVREIVVDENMEILGGNQRFKALQANGVDEVTVKLVTGWTEEQKRQFVIRDNVQNGEWDMDMLANEWSDDPLEEWGINIPSEDEKYKELLDVDIPVYEPADKPEDITELYNPSEADELMAEIDKLDLPEDIKKLFRLRASFFTEFNFQKIADYYAYADEATKELMKKLGLVIVRPKEAYELGMADFKDRFDG